RPLSVVEAPHVLHHAADVGHGALAREELARGAPQELLILAEAEIHRTVPARPTAVREPARSVSGVYERGDGEPVVRDARFLALVEVPALLAREARAREGGLGRVLELQVDHDDRGDEAALLAVVDGVGAVEGLVPERHVVDPD